MREIDLERVICALGELEGGDARAFTLGEGSWPLRGLVLKRGGEVRAYVNWCPHAGHALNLQPNRFMTEDRALLLCHSHGALFDPATGFCIAGPCAGKSLREVPVIVESGYVLLADGVDPASLMP
ncbi:MAG: Rieske 2Fe-2S domain-containing protein [Steroidobacteraceae bacterium]|jgi:nitrite reductase/ring-hydroxylating ferredoxin subunit|nr:Rieske 2Fe-2S domain-containing protein [Steroidobacteraceae bacterium]MCC7199674.1 Rieske 2Fe-2S domain-containing protein [Gammaproteobacteria bacterium]